MAIFSDLIEHIMEVFMDDFSVYGIFEQRQGFGVSRNCRLLAVTAGGPGAPAPGRPASPRGRSSPGSVESSVQGPGSGAIVCFHSRSPTRPTTGVLSPRKVVTKHVGPSLGGARVAQVAALQVVQLDSSTYSSEYSPASPSPPRYCVTGAKVGRGKVLTPPLDRSGVDSPPDSV